MSWYRNWQDYKFDLIHSFLVSLNVAGEEGHVTGAVKLGKKIHKIQTYWIFVGVLWCVLDKNCVCVV